MTGKMTGMMMRTTIKYVERWRDRHGRERIYFRRYPGPRVPLRGPLGSPEFWEDYQAAASGTLNKPQPKTRAQSGTMRWLVEQYYSSAAFRQMKESTRIARRRILERFSEKHGTKRYAHLLPRHLFKIRDEIADTPEAANNLMKALRQVFKFALTRGLVDTNPVAQIDRLRSTNRDGFHTWTPEEVETFEAQHPVETKARLAFALLLYTGQRRGDVVRMGRQHIRDGWITVTQQKTGKRIEIPIFAELQRILDAASTGDLTFLVTSFGKPFTSNGFGNWFRDRCDEAGLKQCSAHGLRKAAATRIAELGGSANEIKSITGHESLQEVDRYTKAAEQKRLAARVRDRMENKSPNPK